ncbi:hypothetical protein [Salibaculum halophilum]|uniref:hypothetical protein n=1 Tax=Salibaculum halophilum TaxID=1914408 RepID=UPI00117BA19A|nr:hypothetical protein [Salibaculum halophilum]
MTREFLLLIGVFAAIIVGASLVRRHAMSKTSLLDISRPGGRAGRATGAGTLLPGLLAILLVVTVLVSARAMGAILPDVFSAFGFSTPVRFGPARIEIDHRLGDREAITGIPWFAATCTLCLGTLAMALRKSAAFVFVAFHAALSGLCLTVDFFLQAPVIDRGAVAESILNTAFVLILISQFIFSFFYRRTLRQVALALVSAVASGAAIALGAAIVATLIIVVNETSFMLLIYLLVAYGIVASHVTAIAMAIAND